MTQAEFETAPFSSTTLKKMLHIRNVFQKLWRAPHVRMAPLFCSVRFAYCDCPLEVKLTFVVNAGACGP